MKRMLRIGMPVIFVDAERYEHDALITAIWGKPEGEKYTLAHEGVERLHWPCINLVHVAKDESRDDQYGRQIDRPTSVVHQDQNSAGGFCWRFPDEKQAQWEPPVK